MSAFKFDKGQVSVNDNAGEVTRGAGRGVGVDDQSKQHHFWVLWRCRSADTEKGTKGETLVVGGERGLPFAERDM